MARNLKDADLSALPAGEKAVLELVALRLLCAVAQPHIYSETVGTACSRRRQYSQSALVGLPAHTGLPGKYPRIRSSELARLCGCLPGLS